MVGRTRNNAMVVVERRARRNTGCAAVQNWRKVTEPDLRRVGGSGNDRAKASKEAY